MEGRIIRILSNVYHVYNNNKTYELNAKGNFKKKNLKPCVGDIVEFSLEDKLITNIKERRNKLLRPSMANLDYCLIVTSLKEPSFSKELLNMFISFLNIYHVDVIIIFTKIDLLDDKELLDFEHIKKHYECLGYKCFQFSKYQDFSKEELFSLIKNKVVAFVGQTGAGKSSLMNYLLPNTFQSIGEYSSSLKRGKHETTSINLIPYSDFFVGDTPGFSSIELHCFKEEFSSYYLNYHRYASKCYFKDCLHLKEKECEVKKHILNKDDEDDYNIYIKLLDKLDYRKDRYK